MNAPHRSSAPRPDRKSTMIGGRFASPESAALRVTPRPNLQLILGGTLGRKPRLSNVWDV